MWKHYRRINLAHEGQNKQHPNSNRAFKHTDSVITIEKLVQVIVQLGAVGYNSIGAHFSPAGHFPMCTSYDFDYNGHIGTAQCPALPRQTAPKLSCFYRVLMLPSFELLL